jgi:hypothetical protein
MSKPNCHQCKHFYITWNPKIPNGCKKFQIQCKDQPSAIVAAAGQGECQGYELKKRPEAKTDPLDLNRKDYW